MAKIKAVIFDMDGVLIDAKEWHYEALNRALGLFGMEISRHDHLITYDGLPTKTKLKMLSMERGLPQALHGFINEMKQVYTMEVIYAKCKPIFHHQFALTRLQHEGYRMAVCSNSIRHTIEMMLERASLMPMLEFFLSNEDVQLPKPAPEIYNVAIARLGLQPDECLIVEDNPNGIKAARESGAHVLCVNDVSEVNYLTIKQKIAMIEAEHA
ncbi:HAD-IA family hydrolase [Pseudoduganella sp. FT25W]|jgi:beta-phosphoglucomutase-like phosphatase (HAD superfamily)|uniref:HAD-IA family hydrolase n=1 Tax=Duganella alba TaxID=2666081 RepID=A0A6L5QIN8_9BURK|nr:HAD family phosphatase [Duganella alba]MRX09505.1 HAD-IA family hydrolase [Duganella alba]MRX17598.1 HAD-IA family hydrolase [Duganella alba]